MENRWKVTIVSDGNEVLTELYDLRPLVTHGEGLTRISGIEGEKWVRTEDIQSIVVEPVDHSSLLKLLDQKDFDQLTKKAFALAQSKDGEEKVMSEIVMWAIADYRIRREAIENIESQREEENASTA